MHKKILALVPPFVLLFLFMGLFLGSAQENGSNQTVERGASWQQVCVPITTSEYICRENQCLDWTTLDNGTVVCSGGYGEVCRWNNITKQRCSRVLFSGQMNYFDGTEFTPINTTLTADPPSEPLYDYGATRGAYRVFFKSDPSTAESVRYYYNESYISGGNPHKSGFATFQPMSLNYRNDLDMIQQINMIQTVTGFPDDNKFTYPNAFGYSTNLTYEYWQETLKERLIVENISLLPIPEQYIVDGGNATLDLDFLITWKDGIEIYIDGVLWDRSTTASTQSRVDFRLGNDTLFYLPEPRVYDSSDNSTLLTYQFKKSGNNLYVVLKTNYTWLNSSERIYPVEIDPTIKLQTADTENLEDIDIHDDVFGDHNEGIILIKFDISSISGSTIDDAVLNLSIAGLGTWDNDANIYRIDNQTWTEDDSVANLKGLTHTDIIEMSGFCSSSIVNDWCNTTNISSMIQTEVDAGNVNVSFWLEDPDNNGTTQDESSGSSTSLLIGDDANAYRTFWSKEYATASLRPYLNITYTGGTQNISGCTVLNNPSGIYQLTADITDSTTSNCMDITANNVTLDCQGNTIDGNNVADYGIRVQRSSVETTNVTMQNCTLTDWDTAGIYLFYSDSNTLTNITSNSNADDGIYLLTSDSNTLTNITSNSNNDAGIHLHTSDSNTLTNITSNSNFLSDYGIYFYYSDSNTLINSSFINNSNFDIYYLTTRTLFDCKSNFTDVIGTDGKPIVFYNDTITIQDWDNNISEIILCGADDSIIDNFTMDHTDKENNALLIVATQNAIINNSDFRDLYDGIHFYYSDSNTLTNITSNSNADDGIYLFYSDSNTLTNITSSSNTNYGIHLYVSDSNTLTNITSNSNADDGIYLFYSALNTINDSKIENNIDYGIRLRDSDSGGANNIYNNFFNNTDNIQFTGTVYNNNWNTTKQTGARIHSDGTQIGGNYYTNSTGDGYSDTCTDSNYDGFCDDSLTHETNNIDYLPLSDEYNTLINSNQTYPASPQYNSNIIINANVTAVGATPLWVNFTLLAPNGTNVIDNVNGTRYNTDFWNSTSFTIDQDQDWQITINASDTYGNNQESTWNFTIDMGTVTVTTPDGDQNWSYSQVGGSSEQFNLTLSHDGNSNNTINFTVTGNLSNSTRFNVTYDENPTTVEQSETQKILVNVTSNSTLASGNYTGNITWNRTDSETTASSGNISITVTVSTLVGDINIENTSWSASISVGTKESFSLLLNATGTYNLSSCDFSISSTITGVSISSNETSFRMENGTTKVIDVEVSSSTAGADATAAIKVECVATSSGGLDSDTVSGSLAVSAAAPSGGGGGGGPPAVARCGNGWCEYLENEENCPEDCIIGITNLTLRISPEVYATFTVPDKFYDVDFYLYNQNEEILSVLCYLVGVNSDPLVNWTTFLINGTPADQVVVNLAEGSRRYPIREMFSVQIKTPENISVQPYATNLVCTAQGLKKVVPIRLGVFGGDILALAWKGIWDFLNIRLVPFARDVGGVDGIYMWHLGFFLIPFTFVAWVKRVTITRALKRRKRFYRQVDKF